MRIVVFGASGMVGRAVVVGAASESGYEVVAPDRRRDNADVAHHFDLGRFVRRDDVAINCIAVLRSDPTYPSNEYIKQARRVNTIWPATLAAHAAEVGARVVHVSTDGVFAPNDRPAGEGDPPDATEPYGASKAAGEVIADHVINLRISVIGPAPDRRPGLWEWVMRQPAGATIKGYARPPWAGCTSHQVACLAIALAHKEMFTDLRAAGAVTHFVPNGIATKWAVLARLAAELRPDLKVIPFSEPSLTGRVLVSTTRAWERVYCGPLGWPEAISAVARSAP